MIDLMIKRAFAKIIASVLIILFTQAVSRLARRPYHTNSAR